MKSKILLLPIILLSISFLFTPVQATKPEVIVTKERFTDWIDSYRLETLVHTVTVIKSYDVADETILVSISTTQNQHLYDSEGNLVAVAKIHQSYVGTMKAGQMWTGKMVIDWTINLMEDITLPLPPDLKGHSVVWFEEGIVVKEIGFGQLF